MGRDVKRDRGSVCKRLLWEEEGNDHSYLSSREAAQGIPKSHFPRQPITDGLEPANSSQVWG